MPLNTYFRPAVIGWRRRRPNAINRNNKCSNTSSVLWILSESADGGAHRAWRRRARLAPSSVLLNILRRTAFLPCKATQPTSSQATAFPSEIRKVFNSSSKRNVVFWVTRRHHAAGPHQVRFIPERRHSGAHLGRPPIAKG